MSKGGARESDGFFDDVVAQSYDDDPAMAAIDAPETVAKALATLADGGPALEFGVGTGRIAVPLARLGVPVRGIDLSRAMLERLRAKPGGDAIGVTVGDMTTVRLEARFALVYLVFNTINNLTSQDAQIACFENAARHLRPGGRFVVEVGVPPLRRLPPGQTRLAFALSDAHWGVDAFDVATQAFTSHHAVFEDGATRRFAAPMRYVWPSELDLMARIAGVGLEARWSDWDRAAFDADSERHVSVWSAPGGR